MAEYFESPWDYMESGSSLKDKIKRIDQIIDSLIKTQMEENSGPVEEYHYNDGQTIVKTIYRTPEEMARAIEMWEKLRNKYEYRLTGRIRRLQDGYVNRRY